MIKRSEIGEFGGAWFQDHGLSMASEAMGRSSRVRTAAPGLHLQSEEPVVASHGAAKSAS